MQLEGGTGRVEDGHFWLSGLSHIRFIPEENCLIHSVLNILTPIANL